MAKIPFSKLGLTKNQDIVTVEWNGYNIEVKQYLPINEKLILIANVINSAHDGNKNFSNPIQVEVFTAIEIFNLYTNVSITEKQKEDIQKLYDLLKGSKLIDVIINAIPKEEYEFIVNGINASITAIYAYQNSVLGILDTVSKDYENLNLDASEIQKKIGDPDNLALLKDIMAKLG